MKLVICTYTICGQPRGETITGMESKYRKAHDSRKTITDPLMKHSEILEVCINKITSNQLTKNLQNDLRYMGKVKRRGKNEYLRNKVEEFENVVSSGVNQLPKLICHGSVFSCNHVENSIRRSELGDDIV